MEKYILTTDELLAALQVAFRDDGCFPLKITGWSMRPLLRHELDTVWLRPFCPENCKRGSILLYRRPNGRMVLHRVRKCLPDGYCMNGDAQSWCEAISSRQVMAEAYQICRKGKLISCHAPGLKIWDALWFPTRPIRPILFRIGHKMKKAIHGRMLQRRNRFFYKKGG